MFSATARLTHSDEAVCGECIASEKIVHKKVINEKYVVVATMSDSRVISQEFVISSDSAVVRTHASITADEQNSTAKREGKGREERMQQDLHLYLYLQ